MYCRGVSNAKGLRFRGGAIPFFKKTQISCNKSGDRFLFRNEVRGGIDGVACGRSKSVRKNAKKSRIKHSVLNMTGSCQHPISSASRALADPHKSITINFRGREGGPRSEKSINIFKFVFSWRKSNEIVIGYGCFRGTFNSREL